MAEGRPADGPPTPLSEVVADSDRPSEATIEPGLERTMDFVVEARLVTDVGGSIGIRVLSTPGMIGMMERNSAILSYEHLPEGSATVGFEVCIKHVAAAPRARPAPSARPSTRWSTGASSASTSRCARASARSASARTSAA